MSIKCLMNGLEVNYPCSPACALFGDCVTAFKAQKKANVSTNADRIRSMSDEELAEWLEWFVIATVEASGMQHDDFEDGEREKLLALLKQPAEGE